MNIFNFNENYLHKMATLFLCLIGAVGLGAIMYLAINQLLIILFAIILSIPITALITIVANKIKTGYTATFIFFWVLFAGLVTLLFYVGANSVENQLQTYNELAVNFEETASSFPSWVPASFVVELKNINILSSLQDSFGVSSVGNTLSSVFEGVTGLVILIALVAYLTFSPHTYAQGLLSVVPQEWKNGVRHFSRCVPHILNRWMLGRLVSMLVVGVFTYVGLLLLGIEAALLLALVAALLSFIPNLGPLLSVVPAILIVLPQGFAMILWVIGLYALVQFLESYFITPLIQKKAISVDPALLLSVQIIFGAIFGFIGLLLAGPLLAIVVGLHKDRHTT